MLNSESQQEKTRYWLKLDKNFLQSSHIRVIKAMPNGKDYVIFYLAIMLESIEETGHLRFSELIPYNEQMLSDLTNTNIDIVRSAVQIFETLGLIEKLDDGTIFIRQVVEMTGKRCDSANRVAKYREKRKLESQILNQMLYTTNNNENKEIKTDVSEKTLFAFYEIISNFKFEDAVISLLNDFIQLRIEKKNSPTNRAVELICKKLINKPQNVQIEMLENSIINNWSGVFEPNNIKNTKNNKNNNKIKGAFEKYDN